MPSVTRVTGRVLHWLSRRPGAKLKPRQDRDPGSDGIRVLRIPDLTVIARLAPGVKANEIWVSGDGRTLFATTNDAHRLAVIDVDGGGTRSTNLPGNAGGFLSSEHG